METEKVHDFEREKAVDTTEVAKKPKKKKVKLAAGLKVKHDRFGTGTILEADKIDFVTCDFGGSKRVVKKSEVFLLPSGDVNE